MREPSHQIGPGSGAARRRRSGLVARATVIVAALVVGYVGVTFVQVWLSSRADATDPAEAIIVLGAAQYNGLPSPVLRSRLDHAADLYEAGIAEVIVVTGGSQEGDRFTEGQAGALYLERERGIPASALRLETQGRNSWESLAAAARFLRAEEIHQVLLVSDPYHTHRLRGIAAEVGLDAAVSPTHTSPIGGSKLVRAMAREALAVSVGRIIGYRRLMNVDDSLHRSRQGSDPAPAAPDP